MTLLLTRKAKIWENINHTFMWAFSQRHLKRLPKWKILEISSILNASRYPYILTDFSCMTMISVLVICCFLLVTKDITAIGEFTVIFFVFKCRFLRIQRYFRVPEQCERRVRHWKIQWLVKAKNPRFESFYQSFFQKQFPYF